MKATNIHLWELFHVILLHLCIIDAVQETTRQFRHHGPVWNALSHTINSTLGKRKQTNKQTNKQKHIEWLPTSLFTSSDLFVPTSVTISQIHKDCKLMVSMPITSFRGTSQSQLYQLKATKTKSLIVLVRSPLTVIALCAWVYICIRQLSSRRASTLWFINLTVATCHIQHTFQSFCQVFSWENGQNAMQSLAFSYDMKMATDSY